MSYTSYDDVREPSDRGPLYPRLLRLHSISPGAIARALLVEGVALVAVILVLADVATAWTLLVLPLSVALMVKLHDVVEGALNPQIVPPRPVIEDIRFDV